MSKTLQQLETNVRYRLGNRTDLTLGGGLVQLINWINTAKREIEHSIRFTETEAVTNRVISAIGDNSVEEPDNTYAVLTVYNVTDSNMLDPFPGDWTEYRRKVGGESNGSPSEWIRFAGQVYFRPPADSTDTLEIATWQETSDLASLNDRPVFPGVWHDYLELLATRNGWNALDDTLRAQALEAGEIREFLRKVRKPKGIESRSARRRGVRSRMLIRNPRTGV